jgi:hypothetical protein
LKQNYTKMLLSSYVSFSGSQASKDAASTAAGAWLGFSRSTINFVSEEKPIRLTETVKAAG